MSYSSCLADAEGELMLDTSVFISLSASGVAVEVLQALPQPALIVDVAASEVTVDARTGRPDGDILQSLLASPTLNLVKLDATGLALFEKLVLVLDDGEAATIAASAGRRAIAILDERRARRVCTQELPDTRQASTVDLFAHPAVRHDLGSDRLAEAVHAALQYARLHVREDQRDWVVGLIGRDRAAACNSIPGWQQLRES